MTNQFSMPQEKFEVGSHIFLQSQWEIYTNNLFSESILEATAIWKKKKVIHWVGLIYILCLSTSDILCLQKYLVKVRIFYIVEHDFIVISVERL